MALLSKCNVEVVRLIGKFRSHHTNIRSDWDNYEKCDRQHLWKPKVIDTASWYVGFWTLYQLRWLRFLALWFSLLVSESIIVRPRCFPMSATDRLHRFVQAVVIVMVQMFHALMPTFLQNTYKTFCLADSKRRKHLALAISCYVCQWKSHGLSFGTLILATPTANILNCYWRQRNRGSVSCKGKRFFCSPKRSDRFLSAPSFAFIGYLELAFRGAKRPGCKAINAPASSAGVKNKWSCTPTPPYPCMTYTETTLSYLGNFSQLLSKLYIQGIHKTMVRF